MPGRAVMPRAIVIHAGFHKTGTSTVQQTLRQNRKMLRPYLRSILKWGMTDVLHAARGYSTWRDPGTLGKFRRRFTTLLQAQDDMPRRVLCLSAEELSGHMPGRGELADYSAAPILAGEMARCAASVFPDSKVVFFYSTRDADTWLESAYWEHVKSSSLTMGFSEYTDRYAASADLNGMLDRFPDDLMLRRSDLKASAASPGGPAAPLLTLCGVPEPVLAQLTVPAPANVAPDRAVLLELLAANRAYSDKADREAAKAAILAAARGDK